MWGHYTRITVTHHCGSGTSGIIALLFAGFAAAFAYSAALILIPVIVYTIFILAGLTMLLGLVLTGVHIYKVLRDKPVYEQFARDTQLALDNHRKRDMIRATSQRVEGDGSWPENTVATQAAKR